jgi:hypothetical protein
VIGDCPDRSAAVASARLVQLPRLLLDAWSSSLLVGPQVAALVAEQKSAHHSGKLQRFVLTDRHVSASANFSIVVEKQEPIAIAGIAVAVVRAMIGDTPSFGDPGRSDSPGQ